jgi:hypothetical protein
MIPFIKVRSRWHRMAALACTALVGLACLSGCDFQFRSSSLQVLQPRDYSKVKLPLTIRWTSQGLNQPGGPVEYAVFLDQTVIHPGETLRQLVVNEWQNQTCKGSPACPNAAFLAGYNIYLTRKPYLTLRGLNNVSSAGVPNLHTAEIVELNGEGQRIGERYYFVDFVVTNGGGPATGQS